MERSGPGGVPGNPRVGYSVRFNVDQCVTLLISARTDLSIRPTFRSEEEGSFFRTDMRVDPSRSGKGGPGRVDEAGGIPLRERRAQG